MNEERRSGIRELLRLGLVDLVGKAAEHLASNLEDAVYAWASKNAILDRSDYLQAIGTLRNALPKRYGEWLDTSFADAIACGDLTPDQAISPQLQAELDVVDPRRTGRSLIYRALRNGPHYAERLTEAQAAATQVERSCYNATIERCKISEDAPQRRWESPTFTSIYSSRCATICVNLDPTSSVGKRFGVPTLGRLTRGEISPDSLGAMLSAELCPDASVKERAEIALRSRQTIVERTSKLYRCPNCGARDATYREVQTRCADEPADIFCTCKSCGAEFKGHA